ncbi:hypothetical protein [uncultured Parolsenella sp.]|uniref:hypothetical protein n=1 Tax=uncultured Parolsenella sp. TaxID=2083008 RepID=UPI0025E3F407|nr:hypothetical protein [uncultured Parolsenella sp.]
MFNTTIAATALLLVAALVIVVAAFLPEGRKKAAWQARLVTQDPSPAMGDGPSHRASA